MMVKPKDEEQAIARELRKQGWSYRQIAEELGVSKGSAYNWCHDIELTAEQESANKERQIKRGENNIGAKTNKAKALEERKQYQEQGRIKAQERSRLHMIGCMLYWAEGAKSTRHVVHFANSHVEMMLVFIRFLREELNVPDDIVKVQIHCYAKSDVERIAIENYWLDLLRLSTDHLHKTQVLKGSSKSKNRLDYGVCSIRVQSTELLMHIFGAIQEYGNFENEDWLFS